MAPSQLKQLKASLHKEGIVGPQKSKKQKQRASNDRPSKDKRVGRSVALQGIRDQFNPFEFKQQARPTKFAVAGAVNSNGVIGRPGVTRGLGEETRRKTLLKEMQRRKKVGGITDRRFGEDDPTMTPEERALQRFVKEQERGTKRSSMFDLEDEEDEDGGLTHLGRSLDVGDRDDFDASGLEGSDDEDVDEEGTLRGKKRRRLSEGDDENGLEDGNDDRPERPKTKAEVMKEVISKSKLHRYERQKAKVEDDELRMELDAGLQDIYSMLRESKAPKKSAQAPEPHAEPQMDPGRAALLAGKDRAEIDKEYDVRIRQLAQDPRSVPTNRTKTEEEIATEEKERLERQEKERQRRMRGEESDEEQGDELGADEDFGFEAIDDADGLGAGIPAQAQRKELDVEDEDDFVIEEDLINTDSDASAILEESSEEDEDAANDQDDEDDNEFIADLLTEQDAGRTDLHLSGKPERNTNEVVNTALPYTFPCPQSHQELLSVISDIEDKDLHTVVQRIRALYHPKLSATNKELMAQFSVVLIDHIAYMAKRSSRPSFLALESLIRHVHSLARSYAMEIGKAFREHLKQMADRPMELTAGDLVLLTAICSIFPTSDHFHQVVTPAILLMNWHLGQKIPQSIADLARGLYLCTLNVQAQSLAKRYIPELVNYLLTTISFLSPRKPQGAFGSEPTHEAPDSLRIGATGKVVKESRKIQFWDIEYEAGSDDELVKTAVLDTTIWLVDDIADLWEDKRAYIEIFEPLSAALSHLSSKSCASKLGSSTTTLLSSTSSKLSTKLAHARSTRRPLTEHYHRPLAIKTSIPRFEEQFNPDKHYDVDKDRADLRKLQKEHKKERKGAMRELRKDASFMAREQLRDKKERDEAYEKKQRRLVAEIQGEEGREKNEYERERRARRGKK